MDSNAAFVDRESETSSEPYWKHCGDVQSHGCHEWLDGARREDCPGTAGDCKVERWLVNGDPEAAE